MKDVIKALNAALLKLPWWKKPILIILYPIVLLVTGSLWRGLDKAGESQGDEEVNK